MRVFEAVIEAGYDSRMIDLSRYVCWSPSPAKVRSQQPPRTLHYAQPSVSHQLAKLEAEVGGTAVAADGARYPAHRGRRLLVDRAESILRAGRVGARRTGRTGRAAYRRVRLARFPRRWPPWCRSRPRASPPSTPAIELTLVEAEPPDALSALRNNDVDVALISSTASRSRAIAATPR